NRIQTKNKLPLWIAGTCSWGHFDEIEAEAFSEEIIRMENNGASAIISTSRLITVSSNAYFTREIFKSIFPNGTITNEPIGVIMQAVKDGSPSGELFHLFGDPGMPLALPHQTVSLTNISPDTLHTLDTGRVSGTQNIISGGSGLGFISLRDAERSVTRDYIINSTEQELSYTLPGGTLFKGQFSFNGSAFSTLIRVPKDISYSDATGTINVYMIFEGDPAQEALGTLDNIALAGGNPVPDIGGPIISFENETGRLIRSGDHFSANETLYLRLSDPLGINLTGEVGHEILITDLVAAVESDITHLFLYDENSITTGKIALGDLIKNKEIEIQVKAWDNANNPSVLTIKLYITDDQGLRLFNVFNFPNPFVLETQFSFEISSTAEVSVDIFTLGGRRVCQISPQIVTAGYNFINWDGRDKYGDILANGVYLYRIKAKNGNESISSIGKIAKYQ
ncbi:MAG: C25 family cysteine peptidase, partial [Candidatus Marinimicrobia bacterium]|nr:C25 family cysteine peptidase [Candidatus Neomarinimicrobiota bacterium]